MGNARYPIPSDESISPNQDRRANKGQDRHGPDFSMSFRVSLFSATLAKSESRPWQCTVRPGIASYFCFRFDRKDENNPLDP